MNKNLIKKTLEKKAPAPTAPQAEPMADRPQGLPDKFYDEATGQVKLSELIDDYLRLAEKDTNLIDINNRNMPESYDKYDLKFAHPCLEGDDEIYKKFYDNGFSNQQAQVVYDLAAERVVPLLEQMKVNYESQQELEKLVAYFGSQEKFNEVSREISNWAKGNVSDNVYEALASTADGVIALHKMMSSNEPLISKSRVATEDLNEDKLKQMMKDPRYWRDRDTNYIAKITNGFKKLYPGQSN